MIIITYFTDLGRPRKRLTELLLKSAMEEKSNKTGKTLEIMFKRTPLELSGNKAVDRIRVAVNILEGSDLEKQKAVATDEVHELPCQLALRSIGKYFLQGKKNFERKTT